MLSSIFQDSLKNLSGNLLRSGLTMLGVIIGVASVIAMMAIVEGGASVVGEFHRTIGHQPPICVEKTSDD